MHSRTLAGVGADRRELAAVTRRDHERAAATEAVGHGRNRPGEGESPAASPQRQHHLHKPPSGVQARDAAAASSPVTSKTTAQPEPRAGPPTQRSLSLETAETGGQAGGRVLLFRVSR